MSFTDADEGWLRLAVLIRMSATDAAKDVLDKVLTMRKYGGNSFEERLRNALFNNERQLRKNNHLFRYQIPQVFPPMPLVFPGSYQNFDIGVVANLIKYFVGKITWDADTANLPEIANLHNFDLTKLGQYALIKLLCEYRNVIFHYTGSPPITVNEFNQRWDNYVRILDQLGYDIEKTTDVRSGPLDKTVVSTLIQVIECMRNDQIDRTVLSLINGIALKDEMLAEHCMENLLKKLEEAKADADKRHCEVIMEIRKVAMDTKSDMKILREEIVALKKDHASIKALLLEVNLSPKKSNAEHKARPLSAIVKQDRPPQDSEQLGLLLQRIANDIQMKHGDYMTPLYRKILQIFFD